VRALSLSGGALTVSAPALNLSRGGLTVSARALSLSRDGLNVSASPLSLSRGGTHRERTCAQPGLDISPRRAQLIATGSKIDDFRLRRLSAVRTC